MKSNKAPCIDNLTTDIMMLGGEESVKQTTQIFNQILETKKIPAEWKEAKMIILHKNGDARDFKNYKPLSLLFHMYKLFTRILQKRMGGFWMKTNQENRLVSEKVTQLLTTFKQLIT